MVKDVVTGDCYRADKLLEDHIDDLLEKGNFSSSEADEHRKVQRQADAYSPEELGAILEKYGIVEIVRSGKLVMARGASAT